jgi:hypothetical protein
VQEKQQQQQQLVQLPVEVSVHRLDVRTLQQQSATCPSLRSAACSSLSRCCAVRWQCCCRQQQERQHGWWA